MKEKKILDNITVIIPVHELNDNSSALLVKALNSVAKQNTDSKVIIVHPNNDELDEKITEAIATSELNLDHVKQLPHKKETDFCSQINYGVSKIKTEFFSILELDDEYSDIYFKNVKQYLEAYPDTSMYLPITILADSNDMALALINEAAWAHQFSEKQGFLDINSLLVNNNFMISGAIINREAFEEVGGLKKDIKLFFAYEFLLRFINNDYATMVIPKLGYKHMHDRVDSLFSQYKDPTTGIKQDEVKFYLDSAKNEYFFNPKEHTTREIKYLATESN